jgi:hypothetical protein
MFVRKNLSITMTTERQGRSRNGRKLLAVVVGAAAVLAAGVAVLTRPFSKAPWPKVPSDPRTIYGTDGTPEERSEIPVITPFHLDTDPMEGLLLMNFEGDPDRIYKGFEPQKFDDTRHGRGLLVIGWRLDGRVDVFHEASITLDPETYGIAGKGLHAMVARTFGASLFELGPGGAQLDLEFQDLEGRQVHLLVRETDTRPRHPFGLLAPMGSAATEPPALPLVFVNEFYFVRRAGSQVLIQIDGRSHKGDDIPMILDGTRVHFIRYSADPFIATWNPATQEAAVVLESARQAGEGTFMAQASGVEYELVANGPFREITRMSRREGVHMVSVEFEPAFPHLLALRDEVEVTGAFRISLDLPVGTVTGSWRARREGRALHMEVIPVGGWVPGEAPRAARLLFRAVSMFRTWPTTYVWKAVLQLPAGPHEMHLPRPMRAAWERM